MTDHLEPYRRMARSIRFFPPNSLTHLSQESIKKPLTSMPVLGSSRQYTTTEADVSLDVGPPIDPSEHIATLVHEAVCKSTVLPASYGIQENIGDRISRLTTPKPVESVIIQPKIPQPTSNGTSAPVSPTVESPIDPEHATTLVHEAVSRPTVLPDTYTILEDIGDRISRLTTPKPVDSVITPSEITQPESASTSAQTIEPQPIDEADLKKSLDDSHLEASVSSMAGAEAPTVEETLSDNAVGVVVEPLAVEETTENQSSAVVVEPVVGETSNDSATEVVIESTEVEQTLSDEPVNVAAEIAEVEDTDAQAPVAEAEAAQAPTLLQRVSSFVEAVATAVKSPEAEQKDSETTVAPSPSNSGATEAPAADSAEPLTTTEPPASEAEQTQAPTLLERVSSIVEAASTVLTQSEHEQKDSETVVDSSGRQPTTTEDSAADTSEVLTAEAPTLEVEQAQASTILEQVPSVVEAVATPLRDSEADKKNSNALVERTAGATEKASESQKVEITCPKCESTDIRKNGRRQGKQRYVCKDCGREFMMPSSAKAEEKPKNKASSPVEPSKVKGIKSGTVAGDSTSEASKPQSKKKNKAKGFGGSKKAK